MNVQSIAKNPEPQGDAAQDIRFSAVYRYLVFTLIGMASIVVSLAVFPINATLERIISPFRTMGSILQNFKIRYLPDLLYFALANRVVIFACTVGLGGWALARISKAGNGALLPVKVLHWLLLSVALLSAWMVAKVSIGTGGIAGGYATASGRNYLQDFLLYLAFWGLLAYLLSKAERYLKAGREETAPVKQQISGISGWLVICAIRVISMACSLIVTGLYAIYSSAILYFTLFSPQNFRLMAPFGQFGRLGLLLDPSVVALALFAVFGSVVAIIAAIKLFSKDRGFKAYGVSLEAINIFTALYAILFRFTVGMDSARTAALPTVLSQVLIAVVSALFILYYAKSDRVKNTFVK